MTFPNGHFFEDVFFHTALLSEAKSVSFVNAPCFTYFRRCLPAQITATAGDRCFDAIAGWTVWAFEPDAAAFAALSRNILTHKLDNVIAVNAAVAGEDTAYEADLTAALSALAASGGHDVMAHANLHSLLPHRSFRRHLDMNGILKLGLPVSDDFELCACPTLPSPCLTVLNLSLLKLTAPFAEAELLDGMRDVALDHVIGETWTHLSSDLVYGGTMGLRQTWVPRAGDPLLRLRRPKPLTGHRPGLDVVVAMYNFRGWIQDCVDGILEGGSAEIRALVVDDGSTDGSGDLVRELYEGNDRVVLLTKLNGGCASARNYGRMHSDATHIALHDLGPGMAGKFRGR